jgi:serralysin
MSETQPPACGLCAGLAVKADFPIQDDSSSNDNRGAASAIDYEWPKGKELDVFFINGTPEEKKLVMTYAPIWSNYCSIKFKFHDTMPTAGAPIRLFFGTGTSEKNEYWSWLGKAGETNKTDPSPANCTMHLDFSWMLDDQKADSSKNYDRDFKALTLHEFGHAIALIHEHLRPKMGEAFTSEAAVLKYYRDTFKWNDADTKRNVLKRYAANKLHESKDEIVDFSSIMMYSQPKDIMKDGKAIPYVFDLSEKDKQFVGEIYGK